MTFPATPLAVTVELLIGGVWTNITSDVLVRDGITITRGRGGEGDAANPSQCTLTLDNRQGKYSPRNPLGPYYGQIGRNTQIRVTVDSTRRFWGEVSELPPRWGASTSDAFVPITAAGILRRIGQGTWPNLSAYKGYLLATSPVTYWPCDDGSESDRAFAAAGTYKGSTIHREAGTAVFSFAVGDLGSWLAPTLRINDTVPAAGADRMIGYCYGSDTTPDAVAFDVLWKVDTEVVPAGTLTTYPTGNFHLNFSLDNLGWDLSFRHDGTNDDIQLIGTDPVTLASVDLGSTPVLTAIQDTTLHHLRFKAVQNGANVDCTIYVDGVSVLTATQNSVTLSQTISIAITYDRNSNTNDGLLNVGHVIVWENAANIPSVTDTAGLAHGFIGEVAGRRFERLCDEEGIPFASSGNLDDTLAMGLQFEDSFTNQIAEVEATDQGMIYEPRNQLALGYRTRSSMYSQAAAVTINFTAGQLDDPFEPTDDDRGLRNDVTVQRREGTSYQATLNTGALSVLDPPNGVGRYKDEIEVNVQSDDAVPGLAGWLLTLGTTNEARYPQLCVERGFPGVVANPTLSAAVMTADIGDRLVVTNADALGIYDDISQIIIGYTETIEPFSHRIAFVCVPESPYEVMELDGANSWLDPGDASTLSSSATSTATSLSVATSGFLWSTSGSDYPVGLMVGGEEMTLTAVSGASSPQTFTVTRSVNGVVKAHSSGAQVTLKRPGILGL